MSGIYIPGMDMPTSCYKCHLKYRNGMDIVCPVTHKMFSVADVNILDYRLDNCPLVPVPEHGRLIDANKLFKEMEREVWFDNSDWDKAEDLVIAAPTIIPASGGKENE